ncbi:MAG TPA: carboxypeptidase-like regulatory domain-containing protein [Flavobacterium sp.]|jgi:hypothetical protein
MSKPVKISVPQPCHENWNAMTPVDKGRFCESCQKSVIDFTKASDREIASKVASEGNLCGRFRTSQLNRELLVPKEKSVGWIAAATGVLAIIGTNEASAQTIPATQSPPVNVQTSDQDTRIMGKMIAPQDQLRNITGVVSDEMGPLPGAKVMVQGTDRETQTDIDGRFEIKASQGETLVASFVGTEDATYTISDHFNNIAIVINQGIELGGLIVTGGIIGGTWKDRIRPDEDRPGTFFGRLFHSIGDWLR